MFTASPGIPVNARIRPACWRRRHEPLEIQALQKGREDRLVDLGPLSLNTAVMMNYGRETDLRRWLVLQDRMAAIAR